MAFVTIYGITGLALAYFMLRSTGGIVWNLTTFIFAAIVVGVLTALTFEFFYPTRDMYRSSEWTARRWQFQQAYIVGGIAAAVLGPILGMLVAMFVRRRRQPANH